MMFLSAPPCLITCFAKKLRGQKKIRTPPGLLGFMAGLPGASWVYGQLSRQSRGNPARQKAASECLAVLLFSPAANVMALRHRYPYCILPITSPGLRFSAAKVPRGASRI